MTTAAALRTSCMEMLGRKFAYLPESERTDKLRRLEAEIDWRRLADLSWTIRIETLSEAVFAFLSTPFGRQVETELGHVETAFGGVLAAEVDRALRAVRLLLP